MPTRDIAARSLAGALIAIAAVPLHAQDCVLPVPFQHQFLNNVTASISAPAPGDPCTFSVATNGGGGPTSAGFLHYRRPEPITSVRYGFRIDTSALANLAIAPRAQLFSASSPVVAGSPVALSHVLSVVYAGGSNLPILGLIAARGGNNPPSQAFIPTSQQVNALRLEINVGAGSAGSVRYWLNAPFTDPPTGTIDNGGAGLDNAAWVGVIAAEFGLSSANNSFRGSYAANAIVFDQIESNDDLLFWSNFSSDAQ